MADSAPSFFQGLTEAELAWVLGRLERRQFKAGTTVLREGDSPREIYVIEAGTADIYVADRLGGDVRISRVGPGATLGEMSLFTGQPASATVRAMSNLDVLVLSEVDFRRAAAAFPRIYLNLGAILSERLARSNRRAARDSRGRVILLVDWDAPPLLGYALACSVAWHTRAPTLLVVLSSEPVPELARLVGADVLLRPAAQPQRRAHVLVTQPTGQFAAAAIGGTVDDLCGHYDYVLVQAPGGILERPLGMVAAARTVHLAGLGTAAREGPDLAVQPGLIVRGWSSGGPLRPDTAGVLQVPALDPTDDDGLARGVLPSTTPAGKAIGWAARDLAGLKVGLALGAGSLKGYAHVGVLKVLERAGLVVDYVAGTSIGSSVAAMYALGYSPDAMADAMDRVSAASVRPTLPFRSLLSSSGMRSGLRRLDERARFEDLPLPLAIVGADIVTGQEVVFRRGLIWQAVLASQAIPGIYPPQRVGPYVVVDGGVVNPVPGNVLAEMGADVVIAVRLASQPAMAAVDAEAVEASGRAPSVLQTILRSIDIMQSKISVESAAAATILIEPVLENSPGMGLRSFTQGRRYISVGEAAAVAALPRITAALPWLREVT